MSLARVTFEHHDGIPVAHLEGEVDAANARQVLGQILEPLANSGHGLILDLTATRYLDSAGINVLFELDDLLAARRQSFALLVDAGSPLGRILDLSGVRGTVAIHDALTGALDGVRR